MNFGIGNKVTIVAKEQHFYRHLYKLITCNGTVTGSNRCVTDALFNKKPYSIAIITKDLSLSKNQQLLFNFMG